MEFWFHVIKFFGKILIFGIPIWLGSCYQMDSDWKSGNETELFMPQIKFKISTKISDCDEKLQLIILWNIGRGNNFKEGNITFYSLWFTMPNCFPVTWEF